MDYLAISGQDLVFPANSMNGDTVTADVVINNDNVLETTGEMFFADITSTDAIIAAGRARATIQLDETNDDGRGACTKKFPHNTLTAIKLKTVAVDSVHIYEYP